MAMPALRQIQLRVRGMQIRGPGRPVRQPLHAHLAEHRGQGTVMPALGPVPWCLTGTCDIGAPLLTRRPHIQMILEQLPHQLPRPLGQPLFQLTMGDLPGLRPGQLRDHRLEHRTRPLKPGHRLIRVP